MSVLDPQHATLTKSLIARASLRESDIIRMAFRFWEAKVLLSAVSLKLFDILAEGPMDLESLARQAGVHSRGARDFLDVLAAMGFLERSDGLYANSDLASKYLNSAQPTYLGGLLDLAETRLYPVWGKLTDALRTGQPQNEARHVPDYYSNLTSDNYRLQVFLRAMSGLSMESSRQIARTFPWARYQSFADLGGAEGALTVELARSYKHLRGICFDLTPVRPFFQEYVTRSGVADRVAFQDGDFFQDPLPRADVLIMGHVLHNWSLKEKQTLVRKSYEALPKDGALLVYDSMVDDDRSENIFGLLMSLNMLLVTSGGHGYTTADCRQWLKSAGFRSIRTEILTANDYAVTGIK